MLSFALLLLETALLLEIQDVTFKASEQYLACERPAILHPIW